MSDFKPEEMAYKLYDRLKDVDSKKVGEKLIMAIQNDEVNLFGKTGVDDILAFLDSCFKKDDLVQLFGSWREFTNFKKRPEVTIQNFIDIFEKNVASLKRDGIN